MSATLTIADVLDKAADLIEPEGAWTQNAYARDKRGFGLLVGTDKKATCWCAMGAIDAQASWLWQEAAETLAFVIRGIPSGYNSTIGKWNDAPERTQPEVVAMMRKAAALAREQGK